MPRLSDSFQPASRFEVPKRLSVNFSKRADQILVARYISGDHHTNLPNAHDELKSAIKNRFSRIVRAVEAAAGDSPQSTRSRKIRLKDASEEIVSADDHAAETDICSTRMMREELLLDLSRVGLNSTNCQELLRYLMELPWEAHQAAPVDLLLHITGISVSHNECLGDAGVAKLLPLILMTKPVTDACSVATFPALTCLDLYGLGLTDASIQPLLDSIHQSRLQNGPTITKLKVGDNAITGAGLSMIATALHTTLSLLTQLHIGGNPLDGDGLVSLGQAWATAPHRLANVGLRDVVAVRSVNKNAKHGTTNADRSSSNSVAEGILSLLRAFASPMVSGQPVLIELQLRGTDVSEEALIAFSHGFTCRPRHCDSPPPLSRLESLDLSSTGTTDEGARTLLEALYASTCAWTISTPKALRELFLAGNALSIRSCEMLGRILGGKQPSSVARSQLASSHLSRGDSSSSCVVPLATLNLADMQMPPAALEALFRTWAAGPGDCCLNTLNVSGNSLQSLEGVRALCDVITLQQVPELDAAATSRGAARSGSRRILMSTLIMHNCHITPSGSALLFATLSTVPGRLRVLEMPQNFIGNGAAADALCEMLQSNHVLAKLFLQDTAIRDPSVMRRVEAAVHVNPTLRMVSLGGQSASANALSPDARSRIAAHCERNKRRWLSLRSQAHNTMPPFVTAPLTSTDPAPTEQTPHHLSAEEEVESMSISSSLDDHTTTVAMFTSIWQLPRILF